MAGKQHAVGLLDTSVVIDLGVLEPRALPLRSRISAVTLAELGLGVHSASDSAVRAERAARLQEVEATFDPMHVTAEAARRFAQLAGLVIAAGRSPRPRRMDLLIAAVASVNGLPLYTRNPDDFVGTAQLLTTVAV